MPDSDYFTFKGEEIKNVRLSRGLKRRFILKTRIGSYKKEKKELRMQKGDEIIAFVNDIPIYRNEVEYRKRLAEIAYGSRDNEFVDSFAAIVREKVFSSAHKNNKSSVLLHRRLGFKVISDENERYRYEISGAAGIF